MQTNQITAPHATLPTANFTSILAALAEGGRPLTLLRGTRHALTLCRRDAGAGIDDACCSTLWATVRAGVYRRIPRASGQQSARWVFLSAADDLRTTLDALWQHATEAQRRATGMQVSLATASRKGAAVLPSGDGDAQPVRTGRRAAGTPRFMPSVGAMRAGAEGSRAGA